MSLNVGTADRALRLILALALGAAILMKLVEATLAVVLGVVAAVLALTALVRFCPLYAPFKLSTRPSEAQRG